MTDSIGELLDKHGVRGPLTDLVMWENPRKTGFFLAIGIAYVMPASRASRAHDSTPYPFNDLID